MQKTKDGRRVIWLGHEAAPKNFTALDVTDPRNPKMIIQTELPHNKMRSNSLEVCGDLLIVAHQIRGERGMKPAGFDLWDISTPEQPKQDLALRRVGPALARRALRVVRGRRVRAHVLGRARLPAARSEGPPDLPHRRHPQPVQAGGGGPLVVSGTARRRRRAAAAAPPEVRQRLPPAQHPASIRSGRTAPTSATSTAASSSSTSATSRSPKEISRFNYSPPYNGFTHTAMPLFSRNLLIVTDECTKDNGEDWPKLAWVFDIAQREEPGADLDAAAAAGGSVRQARRTFRRAQPARELSGSAARGAPTTSSSARSSTAACAPTT